MDFLDPREIIRKLSLKETMVAADFGSGSGGWALPLARKLPKGKIYAIDLSSHPLSVLQSKATAEKIFNVQTVHSDVESQKGSTLSSNSLNLVLMTNLLFEAKDKKKVLQEGKRVLKEGGTLLVADWKKDSPVGPGEGKISREELKKMAEEEGLKFSEEIEAGAYHYCLLFLK